MESWVILILSLAVGLLVMRLMMIKQNEEIKKMIDGAVGRISRISRGLDEPS